MQFTGLLKKCLKKLSIVKELWKSARKKLIMSKENERQFRKASKLGICNKLKRYTRKYITVKYHCHITGE